LPGDNPETRGPDTPVAKALKLAVRFGPVVLMIAGLIWALSSGVISHLSLHELKDNRFTLHTFVHDHPFEAMAAYVGIYIGVVSLSLPGSLVLTLSGGFLFGPWIGGLVGDLACSAGATVVFVVCRLAAGDSLERRVSPKIRAVEEGLRKNAFTYLVILRLLPITPSPVVNLAAGIIGMPWRQYVVGTVFGFIPISFIYASLGSGLDKMFDRGEHLGPQIFLAPRIVLPLVGLAVLSILPIAFHRWRARRNAKT